MASAEPERSVKQKPKANSDDSTLHKVIREIWNDHSGDHRHGREILSHATSQFLYTVLGIVLHNSLSQIEKARRCIEPRRK